MQLTASMHTLVSSVPLLVQCLLTDHHNYFVLLVQLVLYQASDCRLAGARLTA